MSDVKSRLADLRGKGWTLAAIADEVGVTWRTMKRWETGETSPDTPKPILATLNALLARKRIPKKRRYPKP